MQLHETVTTPELWSLVHYLSTAAPPQDAVVQWLKTGAPRVTRLFPHPNTRPQIRAALSAFFDGAISLPQCSYLIDNMALSHVSS